MEKNKTENVFDIEYQYQQFLTKFKLIEKDMHPVQKMQLRDTFFAGVALTIELIEGEAANLSEEASVLVIGGMLRQINDHFSKPIDTIKIESKDD